MNAGGRTSGYTVPSPALWVARFHWSMRNTSTASAILTS